MNGALKTFNALFLWLIKKEYIRYYQKQLKNGNKS